MYYNILNFLSPKSKEGIKRKEKERKGRERKEENLYRTCYVTAPLQEVEEKEALS